MHIVNENVYQEPPHCVLDSPVELLFLLEGEEVTGAGLHGGKAVPGHSKKVANYLQDEERSHNKNQTCRCLDLQL